MSKYTFKRKPIETLTREEAIEALTIALDRLSAIDFRNVPEVRRYHADGRVETTLTDTRPYVNI